MFHKVVQVSQTTQVSQYFVPIDLQVLMHENVTEAGNRSEALCKLTRENTDLSQHFYRSVGITRFLQLFHGDDPIGNIDARLRCNLEVALHYVLEVGIGRKLVTCLGLERL